MAKPEMIVFMGGQGSGKGTFAHLLLKTHDYNYVEAGEILRQMPADSKIGKKIARGELLQDNELLPVISDKIPTDKDLILDGFPRTIGQAQWLIEKFADKFDIKIVFLNITEDKMIAHIKNRIKLGGNRADDADENAVHKRIELFKKITMPAVELLRNESRVQFIDVHLPSDDIGTNFAYILEKMK